MLVGQKEKNIITTLHAIANALTNTPHRPNVQGPGGTDSGSLIRLYKNSENGIKYDPKNPATVSDTMALNTVADPMLIRLNKHVTVPVMPILTSGIFILRSTCPTARECGTARSRAKAQSWRDAAATVVSEQQQNIRSRHAESAVPPGMEREACVKISMNGKPVGVLRAKSMSPIQYRMAISMQKPVTPLMRIDTLLKLAFPHI